MGGMRSTSHTPQSVLRISLRQVTSTGASVSSGCSPVAEHQGLLETMPVRHIESPEEFSKILGAQKGFGEANGVLVDFTASWCGPCKMIGPVFDAMANQPQYQSITFLKVDVDEVQDVAKGCGIRAMPTFQSYLNGSKVDELVGADKGKLTQLADSLKERMSATASALGTGRKLGGGGAEADTSTAAGGQSGAEDDAAARRARMAAAAEARLAALSRQQ